MAISNCKNHYIDGHFPYVTASHLEDYEDTEG